MARFFFGNAVWGCLRLRDIPDRGSWQPARIAYWDETYLDSISRLALIGQKACTVTELDDALTASRQAPGIRMLWIHEGLLDEAHRRWEDAQHAAARPRRAHASAVATGAAAGAAAVLLVGLMGIGRIPDRPASPPALNRQAARVAAVAPNAPAPRVMRAAVASYAAPATASPAAHRPRSKAAYAVSVGTFPSSVAAERMKHLVMSKGYIVVVVSHGAVSHVVTPPYRTRAQAERVMRGLEGSGLPARLTPSLVL
mgnify:CR=1 FL=1